MGFVVPTYLLWFSPCQVSDASYYRQEGIGIIKLESADAGVVALHEAMFLCGSAHSAVDPVYKLDSPYQLIRPSCPFLFHRCGLTTQFIFGIGCVSMKVTKLKCCNWLSKSSEMSDSSSLLSLIVVSIPLVGLAPSWGSSSWST